MYTEDLEAAFDEYLDGESCERTSDKLYSALRDAFEAGWNAAFHMILPESGSCP